MNFKFRKGNIFKIENGVKTQITREEYKTLKEKNTYGSPKTKVSKEKETSTDEQEIVRESESAGEEEV
tara:strand:- start:338 stop:541 length:204 start_codon:yes stop_codon:yes gene_type:complete